MNAPVLLALAGLACIASVRAEEPAGNERILGKDVAGWIAHLETHELPEETQQGLFVLGEFGAQAAPAVPLLRKLAGTARDEGVRRLALETLGRIGAEARAAAPDLLALYADRKAPPRLKQIVFDAVVRIAPDDPAVAEAVLSALRSPDPELRGAAFNAAVTVYFHGPKDLRGDLRDRLERALRDAKDAPAAASALRCLGKPGVEPLLRALERARGGPAQLATLKALGQMGPWAVAALEPLARVARESGDPELQNEALYALAGIDPLSPVTLQACGALLGRPEVGSLAAQTLQRGGTGAVPVLRAVLSDLKGAPSARAAAAQVLGKLGAPGADALPQLLAALDDPALEVRRTALEAINELGPKAKAAAEPLGAWLEGLGGPGANPVLRALREDALLAQANVRRDPQAPPLVSVAELADDAQLREILSVSPNPGYRAEAATALRGRAESAQAAENAKSLIAALNDTEIDVRLAAARALAIYGAHAKAATPPLLDWLGSDDPRRHRAALAALAGLGPEAERAGLPLVHFARSEFADDAETRELLGLALRPHGAQAGPWLLRALQEGTPAEIKRIALTVREMGAPGVVALPELLKLAEGADQDLAEAALLAIGAMGQAARQASPALIELLTSPLPERRMAAAWALGDLGLDPLAGDKYGAIEALIAGILDPREKVARAAHSGLVALGPAVLKPLQELLKLDDGEAPYWALRVMARLKADPEVAIPRMLKLTRPGMLPLERGTIAELLGQYAPERPEMIPALVRLLGDREDFVARAAGRTLKQFGARAVPILEEVVRGRDPLARLRALDVLEELRRES
ncbi:MAG: HEAT repeat domain-containing protein [Planctomycetes bacterium]|nr:HEAT repeat domain-containing protein [Planctomycetota bacterium]